MRIIQVAHALHPTDAASRQLLSMDGMLRELGYETAAFAKRVDERLLGRAGRMEDFAAGECDIVIYHMTTGTSFNKWVWSYPRKVALYYHNITPARYFFGNAWGSWLKCLKGRRDLKKIAKNTFFAWGASEYSRRELAEAGVPYTSVLPIAVDMKKFALRQEATDAEGRPKEGGPTLLVVGRGVPHKRQDEAIAAAAWYRDNISDSVRLVIVGNIKDSYKKKLDSLVKKLAMEKNVVFTGAVSDEELAARYRAADALLSMSEHEGFCVPLVEAMAFGLPIFAKPAAAVPETLGGAGVLLEDASPRAVAETIQRTLFAPVALSRLAEARRKRLAELSPEAVRKKLAEDMKMITELTHET